MLNIFTLFKVCDITTPIADLQNVFIILIRNVDFVSWSGKRGFKVCERHTRVMETWSSGITTQEKKLALMIQTGISNLSALLGKGYEHIGSFSLIF